MESSERRARDERIECLLDEACALFESESLKQAREDGREKNEELEDRFHRLLEKGGQ